MKNIALIHVHFHFLLGKPSLAVVERVLLTYDAPLFCLQVTKSGRKRNRCQAQENNIVTFQQPQQLPGTGGLIQSFAPPMRPGTINARHKAILRSFNYESVTGGCWVVVR